MNRLAEWRWQRALSRAAGRFPGSLVEAWQAPPVPATLREARLVALDFETDGLGRDAEVLQAGWVEFSLAGIPLGKAREADIRCETALDREAVTIHSIGETRARAGRPGKDVFEALLGELAGAILVAHHAAFDVAVLQRAMARYWGARLPLRWLCTLRLERRLTPDAGGEGPYRLPTVRDRYGLPDYAAHDALSDAVAAAELLIAQARRLPSDARLRRLSCISY